MRQLHAAEALPRDVVHRPIAGAMANGRPGNCQCVSMARILQNHVTYACVHHAYDNLAASEVARAPGLEQSTFWSCMQPLELETAALLGAKPLAERSAEPLRCTSRSRRHGMHAGLHADSLDFERPRRRGPGASCMWLRVRTGRGRPAPQTSRGIEKTSRDI